jgi:hypothetical protein
MWSPCLGWEHQAVNAATSTTELVDMGMCCCASKGCHTCPAAVAAWLQVDEVKNIMSENIEKVLSRGEKLDLLVDKTDNLMFEVRAWHSSTALLKCTQCEQREKPHSCAVCVVCAFPTQVQHTACSLFLVTQYGLSHMALGS